MRLCALLLALLLAARSAGAAETWTATEQPDLQKALETAPLLKTEILGEPALGVNVWERWMVPNHDGKSWDVLQIYFKEYYGPTWLHVIDLGTGEVRKQRLADGHQWYLSGRALGFDGKFYIAIPSRHTGSMDLFVYDPATNTVEERGEIVKGLGGETRPLATGPDGRIYGTGTVADSQVGLYIYDPKLEKVVKYFGGVGPKHPNGAWSNYVMGVDDTHAYIASGMIPAWYLVSVNIETGEEKVLMESPTERRMSIIESFPGSRVIVPQEDGGQKEYWLYHGEAIPKTSDTPPWPAMKSPWAKGEDTKPDCYFDQIDPDENGNATLWYRLPGDAGKTDGNEAAWKPIKLTDVQSYPHRLNPLLVTPDGGIYGTGDDYAGAFMFDPRTDKSTTLGPRPGHAPYTVITTGNKIYSCGYAGGPLFIYDLSKPWTLAKGGPPGRSAPGPQEPESNPWNIASFHNSARVAIMHTSVLGADGKIYFGGFGERDYTGGGFGWFDPQTQKLDGIWRPFSGYAIHWMAPLPGGK